MRQYFWLSDPPTCDLPSADPIHHDLERLRRQHQLILNSVGDGVYGVDLEGRVTFVNPAAAHMIGWEATDLIGKSMHHLVHHSRLDGSPYPVEKCPIYAAFQDGIVHRVNQEVFWRKDGTHFPVEYISTPMRDEQGKLVGAVVAFRDITQRRWAESILQQANEALEQKVQERTAELQHLNEQLKELSDLKSRMVSMVCHEFRNPLNNISLSVSYLDRYKDQLSGEQKGKYLKDIQANVERMTTMIDDILVIGMVEARKIELQPVELDLVEFCRSLTAEIQLTAPQNPIHFTSQCPSLRVPMDKRLLRSILTNILSNSIHYSPPEKKIQFKLSSQANQIVFQVKDQGIGIPAEDIPQLFEPFHRGRNVSNIPGTGLGLSIVKKFVDLQQGTIDVSSKVGRGTLFTVQLAVRGGAE